MIDISLGKLLLVALIALIVLGPDKLPGAARTAGAVLRRMRGSWDSVRAEVEHELQVEELKRAAREATEQSRTANARMEAVLAAVRQPVQKTVTLLSASAVVVGNSTANSDVAALTAPAQSSGVADDPISKRAGADLP